MPDNVAQTTPGRSDHTAHLLTTTRLYLKSLLEAPNTWGQINLTLNDYHPDPMEIRSSFGILDITDWWRQQEEMHLKYANLCNVAHDIYSMIPHIVGVEARFSLGQVVIGWRQLATTGENLRKQVVVRQLAHANNTILAGADQLFETTNAENNSEMKKEAVESK